MTRSGSKDASLSLLFLAGAGVGVDLGWVCDVRGRGDVRLCWEGTQAPLGLVFASPSPPRAMRCASEACLPGCFTVLLLLGCFLGSESCARVVVVVVVGSLESLNGRRGNEERRRMAQGRTEGQGKASRNSPR